MLQQCPCRPIQAVPVLRLGLFWSFFEAERLGFLRRQLSAVRQAFQPLLAFLDALPSEGRTEFFSRSFT